VLDVCVTYLWHMYQVQVFSQAGLRELSLFFIQRLYTRTAALPLYLPTRSKPV